MTLPTVNVSPPPKPVSDLSPRVVELARAIDRLTPGNFIIAITKGARIETAEISRVKKERVIHLQAYVPE